MGRRGGTPLEDPEAEAKRLAWNAYHREYRKQERWREWSAQYTRKYNAEQRKPLTPEQRDNERIRAFFKWRNDPEHRQKLLDKEKARYRDDPEYRARRLQGGKQYYHDCVKKGLPKFKDFVAAQREREGYIGMFASDVGVDANCPRLRRLDTWMRYLRVMKADDWAFDACRALFAEYEALMRGD